MSKVIISREGLQKFKEELEYLKKSKRKEVAERIKKALEQGDLSENAEYAEAKDEQAFVEGKILELEDKVKNAEIISKPSFKSKIRTVKPGSKITVESDGSKMVFEIVGSSEANPSEGRISNESPIGSALLDHQVGDAVEARTPSGQLKYKILKIE